MQSISLLFIGLTAVFLLAFAGRPTASVTQNYQWLKTTGTSKLEPAYTTEYVLPVQIRTVVVTSPAIPKVPVQTPKVANVAIDLDIIAAIESGGNKRAYRKSAKARGLYQLRIAAWTDAIKGLHKNYDFYNWKHIEKYSPEVADYYFHKRIPEMLKAANLPVTYQTTIAAWNYGITNLTILYRKDPTWWETSLPAETRNYIESYENLAKSKND